MVFECVQAVLTVMGLTVVMFFMGHDTLGETVIGLLYLLPIGWSTTRWGQGAGMCAAVIAFLCFNFFFIPPFFTFTVGSLQGWLVLIIFLAVAVVIVGRIQFGLSQAQAREREAIFMYELTAALAGLRTTDAVAHVLANRLQQLFQARLVRVTVYSDTHTPALVVVAPTEQAAEDRPDRVLPLIATRDLVGEIGVWRGELPLPTGDNRLLQNLATQGALALERARLAETERL
jgi:two-component system sensor histidine kinase KdpD